MIKQSKDVIKDIIALVFRHLNQYAQYFYAIMPKISKCI